MPPGPPRLGPPNRYPPPLDGPGSASGRHALGAPAEIAFGSVRAFLSAAAKVGSFVHRAPDGAVPRVYSASLVRSGRPATKGTLMSRFATTAALLSSVALAIPAAAGAAPVNGSAHFEAHAVADSGAALAHIHQGAQRVTEMVRRSEAALSRAYTITMSHGAQTSAQGMQASAAFSAAAQTQGDDLAAIVRKGRGALKAAAAGALARTGQLQARVVNGLADAMDQQDEVSAQQGDDTSSVGDSQAGLTTTIVVTASGDGIRQAIQNRLDRATAAALMAQARLQQAVADLRDRAQGESQSTAADTQASLQHDGSMTADVVRRSGRADVTFSIDNGSVTLGQLSQRGADTGDAPVNASASGEAHISAGQGGSR